MMVSGDFAKDFNAVRLDSMANANLGELVRADEETGTVVYKDRTGAEVTVGYGAHAIKLVRR